MAWVYVYECIPADMNLVLCAYRKVALILVRYAEEKELKKILKCPSRIGILTLLCTVEPWNKGHC